MQPATPEHAPRGPIDCETAVRRLWDYLDDRLPAMAHDLVEAHLASCELCPPHFEFAGEMRKALAASLRPISNDDEARLRVRVRSALERVAASEASDEDGGPRGPRPTRGTPVLHDGDVFPSLTLDVVGGGTIDLPGDLGGSYAVVLIYRGSWCPYCNAQLAAYARAADGLAELGIEVVALSTDDEATSAALAAKHGLRFRLAYGVDAEAVSAATGAYVSDDARYLQSTGFVLDPNGRVITAVYSSGAVGRLAVDDVLGLVRHAKSGR